MAIELTRNSCGCQESCCQVATKIILPTVCSVSLAGMISGIILWVHYNNSLDHCNCDNYFFNGGGGPYLNNNNYYTGANQYTTLTATLPANVSAVGADFGLQSTSFPNSTFKIGLSTGEQFTFPSLPSSPTFTFLGFVSDQPLTSLTFQAAADFPAPNATGSPSLDNFTLAQAVPEPSAIVLAVNLVLATVLGTSNRGRRS